MRRKPGPFSPRCLKVEDWPPRHRIAWERAFAEGGLFDAPGLAAKRPHSAEKTRKGYGAWIHWRRSRRGTDFAAIETSRPEDLATREAVLAYVQDLTNRNSSMTVFDRIQELYDAIRVMAPASSNGPDWGWLKAAQQNLRSRARPSRDKLARLQTADTLEELGLNLMARAEEAPEKNYRSGVGLTSLQRALAYRDGLMIALLIRRPFRLKNFAALSIGDNFVIDGDAASFAFKAFEMKGKRPMEVPFPAHLMPSLRRYVDHYRPVLLGASGKATGPAPDAVWISRDGTELAQISLHNAIRRRTRDAFGAPLPPHWFRDSAVTTLVRDEPASARLTGSILGHASPEIANRHYNQARMIESARRHDALIEALIEGGDPVDA